MPKVYMKYTCGVCGKPYDHKRDAASCARSHIVPVRIYQPLFRRSLNTLIGAWILFSDGQVCFYSSAKTPNDVKLDISRLSDYSRRELSEIKETVIETPVCECVLCRTPYPSEEKALECEERHPEVANIQSLSYFSDFDLTDDAVPEVAPRSIVVNYKLIGDINQVTTLRYYGFNFDELIGFPDGVDEAGFLITDEEEVADASNN